MKLSPPTRASDIPPISMQEAGQRVPARRSGLRLWLWKRRHFLLFVGLPTLIAAIYLYGFAAGQYVSEARFVVRGQKEMSAGSALSQMIGAAGFKAAPEDAMAVRDYLQSHDAVTALERQVPLVEMYRRPEADGLARLWSPNLPAEFMLMYFRHMNSVEVDSSSGITTIRARGFRPDDAQAIAEAQLRISEDFVNQLSARSRAASLQLAQTELDRAEQRVVAAQEAITEWRQREQAVDPAGLAQIGQASMASLESALNAARTELQEKSAFMRPDNPQIANLRNRIDTLERRIRAERGRLTTGQEALPERISAYERLATEREFANRQLSSATASLEAARVDAQRQQLFLSRVVEPNLADYPLYPRSSMVLLSIFGILTMIYGIGWLLLAGVREHAL
jgi:capsular polysaccharide transport system permease protein